eukprot:gene9101-10672_t
MASNKTQSLEQTAEGWDTAAEAYSQVFAKFTEIFSKEALDLTMGKDKQVERDVKVLDVAAGCGSTTFLAAERVKDAGGSVLATDFSPLMIEQIKSKIGADSGCVEAQVMDGQNLTLPDNSFNYVYSTFGLIFFPDKEKGMTEIYRVLMPGGKVAIVAWSHLTPLSRLSRESMMRLDSTYVPKRPLTSLGDPEEFKQMLETAGFKDVVIHESRHDFVIDLEDFVAFGRTNPVQITNVSSLPSDKAPLFDDTFRQVAREYWPVDPLRIPCLGYIGLGQK